MGDSGRILFLASTLQVGGGEQILTRLISGLRQAGRQPEILFLKQPGPLGERLERAGLPIKALGLKSTRHPLALFHILKAMRRHRYQLVYIQDHHDCLFWGRLAAALAGFLPVVVPVHNSGLAGATSFRIYNRLLAFLNSGLVHLGCWHERILSRSDKLCEGFWTAIPNPVDASSFSAPVRATGRDGPFVIGTVAALRPEKRQERLLPILSELLRSRPTELWLVGDGPMRESLERSALEADLSGHVRFFGQREDIPELLSGMDLFVLTSAFEAQPVSLLEALSAGVAVAAPSVGGVPQLLAGGRRGLLLDQSAPESWPAEIAAFADRLPAAIDRARFAQEVGEDYSVERFMLSYIRLFDFLGDKL